MYLLVAHRWRLACLLWVASAMLPVAAQHSCNPQPCRMLEHDHVILDHTVVHSITELDHQNGTDFTSHSLAPRNMTVLETTTPQPRRGSKFLPWDNPDNVISFRIFSLIERALICYINPAIWSVGSIGNAVTLLVLARQGLGERMTLCLWCLAMVDLLFLTVYTASGLHCWLPYDEEYNVWWKWTAHAHVLGLYRGLLLTSGCITVVVAVERCVCVLWPLHAGTLVSTRTMAAVMAVLVLIVQGMCVVFPLKVDVVWTWNKITQTKDYRLVPSALFFRHPDLFNLIEKTLLMNILPLTNFVLVTIATAITAVQLQRQTAWRVGAGGGERGEGGQDALTIRQAKVTRMLVMVSALFVATSCPFVAFSITTLTVPDFFLSGRYSNLFLALHAMHMTLAMVNSSCNFFIFTARSSRFRVELRHLCSFCLTSCASATKKETTQNTTITVTDCRQD